VERKQSLVPTCYSGKWLIEHNQELSLVPASLVHYLKQKELPLTTRQASNKSSSISSASGDRLVVSFLFVDLPIRQLARIEIWNFGDNNVGADRMVLSEICALVHVVHLVQKRRFTCM
jgi:hypothetical protein